MAKKPPLTLVTSTATGTSPPRKLGAHGQALWDAINAEYDISDAGGVALLSEICGAKDRIEEMATTIAIDGATILVRGVPREHPLLKAELANRAFVTRNLQRLGLNLETIKPVGRPAGWSPK